MLAPKDNLEMTEFVRKFKSGNSYQLTKFQVPSSNTFQDILLTSLKCQNLQRAITPEIFNGICSKVHQVIYSPSHIGWLSFKSLAQIRSEISRWQYFILIFYLDDNISFWFFQRDITLERDITQTRKKKKTGQLFFHEESIYEISKP